MAAIMFETPLCLSVSVLEISAQGLKHPFIADVPISLAGMNNWNNVLSLESKRLLIVTKCALVEEANIYICPERSSVSLYIYKLCDDLVGNFINLCLV